MGDHTSQAFSIKLMTCSSVSSQPSQQLESDNTQSGGPLPLLPACRQTAGDTSCECFAILLVIWIYILIAPEID